MVYKKKKIKSFLISESQPAAIYIRRRYTNFFVTLTDFNNKVIVCKTAGSAGIYGSKRRKTTPQTIESIVTSLDYYFKRYYIKNIRLILQTKITTHMFTLVRYLSYFNVKVIEIGLNFAVSHGQIRKRTARRK